ncbi:hypothetical protein M8818_002792 [Zalaria obscura]|uniref:Uncharacterized protein n=1 Tax=Zalaria obscura TaxID=2024903 RepID=A0ACC3SHX3_9PEZI
METSYHDTLSSRWSNAACSGGIICSDLPSLGKDHGPGENGPGLLSRSYTATAEVSNHAENKTGLTPLQLEKPHVEPPFCRTHTRKRQNRDITAIRCGSWVANQTPTTADALKQYIVGLAVFLCASVRPVPGPDVSSAWEKNETVQAS